MPDVTTPTATWLSRSSQFFDSTPGDNRLTLKLSQAADESLVGRVAIFENDGIQDAAYTIRGVRKAGDLYEFSTGDSTLVRGYANPKDLAAGYVHNVRPGDPVRIPLGAHLERRVVTPVQVHRKSRSTVALPTLSETDRDRGRARW